MSDEDKTANQGTSGDRDGAELLEEMELSGAESSGGERSSESGVVDPSGDDLEGFVDAFAAAIAAHRHWDRAEKEVPA